MRKDVTFIQSIGLSLFILTACSNSGSNKVSEKELELQKKEVELKQKDSISKIQPMKPTAENATTQSAQTAGYNFDKHGDIKVFIHDLAQAVNNNDRNSIAQMINFPFKDEWGDNSYNQSTPLGCNTQNQFFEKYDKIFTTGVRKSIASNDYRGWTDDGWGDDVINKGEYLIKGDGKIDGESKRPHNMLGIKKFHGKFKIYAIKFYS